MLRNTIKQTTLTAITTRNQCHLITLLFFWLHKKGIFPGLVLFSDVANKMVFLVAIY